MHGIEKALCNASIDAILAAYYAFMNSDVSEALRPILAYGKSDTLGMDAMPEITITEKLQKFDPDAIVITEERGAVEKLTFKLLDDPQQFQTVFISDPTDRSKQIETFLKAANNGAHLEGFITEAQTIKKKVRDVLHGAKNRERWEAQYGIPAEVTGGSSAITCIRYGKPSFSVIVNYITEQLHVVCSAGTHSMHLPEERTSITLDQLMAKGAHLFCHSVNGNEEVVMRRFVTFLGKTGYLENLRDSKLMTEDEIKTALHYELPGGPLRILYLTSLQPKEKTIGFILANGEKIGEWIHWLPYVRFARRRTDQGEVALRLFEVFQERPHTKEGVLMSTPPAYSIFKPSGSGTNMIVNINRFRDFENPSKIRATLIVAPCSNSWATRVVNQYGYREIKFD